MKILIMSGQFQMILSCTLELQYVLGGGHIILPNFDVGHHPDELRVNPSGNVPVYICAVVLPASLRRLYS